MTTELGSFGDIVFEVSDSRVRTFKDLQQQKRGRYSVINVANHEQLLQYEGKALQEVSFTIQLHHRFCDPMAEIDLLRMMVEEHQAYSLIVGGFMVGEFVLEEMGSNWETVAKNGVITMAEGQLKLKEYV